MISEAVTSIKQTVRLVLYGKGQTDQWLLMVLSAVIGVIAGYGAIGFYLGIDLVVSLVYGGSEKNLATTAAALPWWHIMLALVGGGLLVGQLLRLTTDGRALGVPQVMESSALRNGHIPFRQGLLSAGITITSLGVGASAGREGPVVHLGATLASSITRWLHLPPGLARTLLGCGVAAAVAASFNAPFAGVFFALEVIIGHYALHVLTPIVISAIIGTIISRVHLGDFPAFSLPDYAIVSYAEFPAFFLLGLICSAFAIFFMRSLNIADKLRLKAVTKSEDEDTGSADTNTVPNWLKPAIGGALMGLIALKFPEILSVGYEATSSALNGSYSLPFLLALVGAKMLATVITLASRFGGGVFSPSLFIGAMVGGSFGLIASLIFPDMASTHGLYAIVGMGAMASAVLGAPISTMLIVFEITGDYSITIAVMIAASVSSLFTSTLYRRSFFHMQLANQGLHLEDGRASYLLKSATISDHYSRDFFTISKKDSVEYAKEVLIAQEGGKLIVTDETGAMVGSITFANLPHDDQTLAKKPLAGDICDRNPIVIYSNDTLEKALNRFTLSGESQIAVLDNKESGKIVGLLHHRDVMDEYNKALLEAHGQDK